LRQQITPDGSELQRAYSERFAGRTAYRKKVWMTLVGYFERFIPEGAAVLDLGAGYCEFINSVRAGRKYAMDLNPDVVHRADSDVQVLQQDCTTTWAIGEATLDVVFTSNFLEHLPDKRAVKQVLEQAFRSLKPGGRLIAMGPNIKCVPGAYWDFFDHFVPLTEASLSEAAVNTDFEIERSVERFLPYSMSHGSEYPIWTLRLYLALPVVWRFFGKQFLVVAVKPLNRQPGNEVDGR
jgi:SAM-dependent methyltransferase